MRAIAVKGAVVTAALMLLSGCHCWFFCYDDTKIQRTYVDVRDDCQDQAEDKVGFFSRFTQSSKERNATLLALFADCMHKDSWGVTSPKQKNKGKDVTNFPGIPPATPAIKQTDPEAERQFYIRENQRQLEEQRRYYEMRQEQQRQHYDQRQEQQKLFYESQQDQQMRMQQQQQSQKVQQEQKPQVIQREIIREVPAQPQPQPQRQVIEKHYYQQAPAQPAPAPQVIERNNNRTIIRQVPAQPQPQPQVQQQPMIQVPPAQIIERNHSQTIIQQVPVRPRPVYPPQGGYMMTPHPIYPQAYPSVPVQPVPVIPVRPNFPTPDYRGG